jgi:hypothetical protein
MLRPPHLSLLLVLVPGPFQFVEGTFLDIVRRKLPALTVGKSDAEISRLRVDPKVSRDAALIYIRESAKFFAARNVPITAATLRLAFFVGQTGALKVLALAGVPTGRIAEEAMLVQRGQDITNHLSGYLTS